MKSPGLSKNERHKRLMMLRDMEDSIQTVTLKNGETVLLNLSKHFLMGIPYKNEEMNKELIRFSQKMYKQNLQGE